MSYRTRKILCVVVLVLWLPIYIAMALFLVDLIDRPGIVVETLIYVVLGVVWALPFKSLFKGIGRPDPAAPQKSDSTS